jgi:hypothetical protein
MACYKKEHVLAKAEGKTQEKEADAVCSTVFFIQTADDLVCLQGQCVFLVFFLIDVASHGMLH